MPSKYGVIQIQGPIDELCEYNCQFWAKKSAKITNFQISENGLIRRFEIKSKPNMHMYAYSFGEKYSFQFIHQSQSRNTTIIISCKYSVFGGRGFIWKIPQETINEWVKFMEFPHIELADEPSPAFLAGTTLLTQVQTSSKQSQGSNYCPHCGVKIA